jgi:hypothetical protein
MERIIVAHDHVTEWADCFSCGFHVVSGDEVCPKCGGELGLAVDDTVMEILKTKKNAGEDAYLWLHTSGDCILWLDEESSVNDDGQQKAIERWQLDSYQIHMLTETGEVDNIF